jgi:hypothetical protein
MTDEQWKIFFTVCNNVLGRGEFRALHSESWCSWTTFRRLNQDAGYWTCGLPNRGEYSDSHIKDGGTWGQPFSFQEIAHIIVPKVFYWETVAGPEFKHGTKMQDIDKLSEQLSRAGIIHRKTDLLLEIKLY